MKLLVKFNHGLGDAVQLLYVVKQLKQSHNDWDITVAAGRGKHSLFHGIADDVLLTDFGSIEESAYDRVEDLSWPENRNIYPDAACTKGARCLSEVFNEQPQCFAPIRISPSREVLNRVRRFITNDLQGRAFALIHYQGNTASHQKNIAHERASLIAEQITESGLIPVLLDWDNRSPLSEKGIICPGKDHALWSGYGTGDGSTLVALINEASWMIAVDSGPGHVAGLTDTPTIIWWKNFHPIFYAQPTANILHLVPRKIHKEIPEESRKYFEIKYRFRLHDGNEETIIAEIGGQEKTLKGKIYCLYANGMWVRKDYCAQDLVIVGSVYRGDEYRTSLRGQQHGPQFVVDIGANIGAFARRWHEINPEATIICIEADPANIPILEANVGSFAKIIHAACTYEKEKLRLYTSVFPGSGNSGGSTVMPESEMEAYEKSGLYRVHPEPIKTITLEEITEEKHIDVLKLDCEGAEFSILKNTPSLDRIGFIFGEWHNRASWQELLSGRLAGWDYGKMSAAGKNGIFHLRNPKFPASGVLRWIDE